MDDFKELKQTLYLRITVCITVQQNAFVALFIQDRKGKYKLCKTKITQIEWNFRTKHKGKHVILERMRVLGNKNYSDKIVFTYSEWDRITEG